MILPHAADPLIQRPWRYFPALTPSYALTVNPGQGKADEDAEQSDRTYCLELWVRPLRLSF